MPEDDVPQPTAIAVAVVIKTVDDSKPEQIKLEQDITEKKSSKEEQTPQYVAEDTAEINTNTYTDEHHKAQTSEAEVKEGIEDDKAFGQHEEAKAIAETNKMKLAEEDLQTALVQHDTDHILHQELLHVDESEVIDYVKQSSIPEIEHDRKSTIVQVRLKWCI